MVKKLSCVSYGSLKRFPHTFIIGTSLYLLYLFLENQRQTINPFEITIV